MIAHLINLFSGKTGINLWTVQLKKPGQNIVTNQGKSQNEILIHILLSIYMSDDGG